MNESTFAKAVIALLYVLLGVVIGLLAGTFLIGTYC